MTVVRDLTAADMPAITAIYAHHTLHGLGTFDEKPLPLEEMEERADAVRAQKLPWLVAELNGAVAGYAYAMLFHARRGWRYTLENSVYIAPGLERRGIGRAVLSELIARCEVMGYRQMIAAIGDRGNAGSIGLHEALGFSHAGVYHNAGLKAGRWLDVVLMQRALGEGAANLPDREPGPEIAS